MPLLQLAFFINIYNALVIHAFVEMGPPTRFWQRIAFFRRVSYVIGGQVYSLNDIEHGTVSTPCAVAKVLTTII